MSTAANTPIRAAKAVVSAAGIALALLSGSASAQTTFDVIGPHEYDLPVNFDQPFNVFVQYATVQRDSRLFDNDGDRQRGNSAQKIIGLSKYVRFWTSESNRNIGLAFEVIQPTVGIRNRDAVDPDARHISGFGDTITGAAIWYKPTPGSTLGFQTFLQIPIGDKDVSDTNWKNLSSLLWYVPLTERIGWTGDLGFVAQSRRDDGNRPGMLWHTNNRFGYRVNDWLEPFAGVDYERISGRNGADDSWGFDGSLGVMFHYYGNQSIALRYSHGIEGENRPVNNSINIKYAYVW
ncbi:transporter [Methyloversatilis discipulorum]|uniref:transporter n=1 Tax=Methyloversatilis discipulorum TaxID=1119528 RepID=UPI0003816DE4|nr:transporter [Methyloversatilis discipulorum]